MPPVAAGSGWITAAKRNLDLLGTVQALGLTVAKGNSFGPCPSCHRATRASEDSAKAGKRDKRGACAIKGTSWHCYTNGSDGCGAKGSVVDLVAWQHTGSALDKGNAEQCETVRAWCENRPERPVNPREMRLPQPVKALQPTPATPVNSAQDPPQDSPPLPDDEDHADHARTEALAEQYAQEAEFEQRRAARQQSGRGSPPVRPPIAPPATPRSNNDSGGDDRPFADAADVDRAWQLCVPVTYDAEVSLWLWRRGLDPKLVAACDAARALPVDAEHDFMRCGAIPWGQSGHRLILRGWCPLSDALGTFRPANLHCRYTGEGPAPNGKKALWGQGIRAAGCVFVLKADPWADGFRLLRTTITEGATDYLTWAIRPEHMRGTIMGIWSGGVTTDTFRGQPERWNVVVRDHADSSGERYFQAIARVVNQRDLRLWRRSTLNRASYKDDNDALCDGADEGMFGERVECYGLRGDSLQDAEIAIHHSIPQVGHITFPYEAENAKGVPYPLKNYRENTKALLDAYGIKANYDLMSHQLRLLIPNYQPAPARENNARLDLLSDILARHGLNDVTSMRHLSAFVTDYHPVAEWIDARPWDGKDRISDLVDTLELADGFDRKWAETLLKRWMIGGCRAIIPDLNRPDFAPQLVLVLQGAQGIQKSRWFQSLCPPGSGWVGSGMQIDPTDKDSVEQATCYFIVENAEVDGMTKRKEQANIKAFLTRTHDVFRAAYERRPERRPRQTIFGATVNTQEFLNDATGNRRWGVLPVLSVDANHTIDTQQLWAQAASLARKGERHYLNSTEIAELANSNRKFEQPDDLVEELWEIWEPAIEGMKLLYAPRVKFGDIWAAMPTSQEFKSPNFMQRKIIQNELTKMRCKHATKTENRTVYAVRRRDQRVRTSNSRTGEGDD